MRCRNVKNSAMLRITASQFALALLFVSASTRPQIVGQNVQPSVKPSLSDDLTPVQQEGKWGYVDKNGKIIIKPQFSSAGRFSEGLALVSAGGVPLTDPVVKSFVKMGYIDKRGHWLIASRFEYYFFYDFSDGLVPFRKLSSKWGYMDRSGKIAIEPRFDWAGSFTGSAAPVLLESKCARIDRSGKISDQSQTVLLHQKYERDSHGPYLFKPHSPPCS